MFEISHKFYCLNHLVKLSKNLSLILIARLKCYVRSDEDISKMILNFQINKASGVRSSVICRSKISMSSVDILSMCLFARYIADDHIDCFQRVSVFQVTRVNQ